MVTVFTLDKFRPKTSSNKLPWRSYMNTRGYSRCYIGSESGNGAGNKSSNKKNNNKINKNSNNICKVSLTIKNSCEKISTEGAKLNCQIEIENYDLNDFYKEYIFWLELSLPDGKCFSPWKARSVFLRPGENFMDKGENLLIPAEYSQGEYVLSLHVYDRCDGCNPETYLSVLRFVKEGNSSVGLAKKN